LLEKVKNEPSSRILTEVERIKVTVAKIVANLEKLSSEIASGHVGRSSEPWQGADVVITEDLPVVQSDSFYPTPRFVVTKHVGQLSWLFEEARDAFIGLDGYGFWKEEFFGRLGNSAIRFIRRHEQHSPEALLLAVIHEAFCIAEEMENGEFKALSISVNNEIFDDIFREIEAEGLAEQSEVNTFIKSLGIDL